MERIGINDYYMNIAVQVSLRSTCTRRRVGAVIVKDNRILSTGYNGSPSKIPNCTDFTDRCYRSLNNIPSGEKLDLCYAIHAEQNAIMNALRTGESLEGASIYITTFPCSTCAKLILQSGIRNIYYIDTYKDNFTMNLLIESGATLEKLNGDIYQTPKGTEVITVNDLDNIDPLVNKIYKYKPGTPEFIKNRDMIFKENNLYERYNEDVFYTTINLLKEIIPFNAHNLDSLPLRIENRNKLEYNGDDKKQLVAAALVYDIYEKEYYVLKCKNGRLKDKLTMVQGHVAFNQDIIAMDKPITNSNIIEINLDKELEEEINLRRHDHRISIPTYIISTNDNKISSEHMGVLYIVNIDTGKYEYNLKSMESDKHELVKIHIEEFYTTKIKNQMDTWLRKFVEKMVAELTNKL